MSNEPDSAAIIEECSGALISAVNVAEIYSKTSDVGITSEEIDWAIDQLQIRPIVCDLDQARVIGSLREPTRKFGLSLGHRACLALGLTRDLPVITSDSQLAKPRISVDVRLFRRPATRKT